MLFQKKKTACLKINEIKKPKITFGFIVYHMLLSHKLLKYLFILFCVRYKIEGYRIHTVSFSGRGRSIINKTY
jgi:hypothetical protein